MGEESGHEDALDQRVDEVIALYLESEDAGGDPAPEDWINRHPDLAPLLREFFEVHRGLGRLVGQSGLTSRHGARSETEPIRPAPGRPELTQADPLSRQPREGERLPLAFGKYELQKRIGRGGQGVVYRARQVNPSRVVALKMVRHGDDATAEEVRRFRGEADKVGELDHPNIVPIYDVGEHRSCWYFTMRLMEGGSLDRTLARYQSDRRSAGRLLADVARAVQHAHDRGILHRDLKPSNVLFDAEGRAHVSDFGLAKRLQPVPDGQTTETGAVVGTPAYMAPEQAAGKKGAVTTATDVYGLGAILYTILRGQPPFQGDSVLEILEKVRLSEPEPLRSSDRSIDRDLETICLTCLRKDPRRRYDSAKALAEDLERWLRGEPILARPVSHRERAMKWARRQPAVASLAAAVAMVTILGVSLGGWQWRRAVQANARLETTLYFQKIALAERAWMSRHYGEAVRLLGECPEGLRGWEWNYLVGLRERPKIFEAQHQGEAYRAAFSPGGGEIVTAGGDRRVFLRDAVTGQVIREFLNPEGGTGHTRRVRSVAFDRSGRRIASVGWDGIVNVWEVASGRLLASSRVSDKVRLISVAFSPDGTRLAVGGDDQKVRIWGTGTWSRPPEEIVGGHGAVLGLAYSRDGRWMASAGNDGCVTLWGASGRERDPLGEKGDPAYGVSFSPDSGRLAVAKGDGTVVIWDVRGRRPLARSAGRHSAAARHVAFSPDGRRIASAGGDGEVKVWDAETGEPAISLAWGRSGVTLRSVAFSPDGTRLAASGSDGRVKIWDAPLAPADESGPRHVLVGHGGVVFGVAFSPDGTRIASCGGDHTLRVWENTTNSRAWRRATLLPYASQVHAAAFDPRGRLLAVADNDGYLTLWDARTFTRLSTTRVNDAGLWCVAFSPDGRRLAAGGSREDAHVWGVDGGGTLRAEASFFQGQGEVWSIAFTPDGTRLITGGSDHIVRVRHVSAGGARPLFELSENGDEVYGVAVSPDGQVIASAGLDRTVRLWRARTGEAGPVHAFDDRLDNLAYSPDGRYLAVACGDATVKILDPSDLSVLEVLYGHTSRILAIAFSRDSRRLVSSSFDQTVRVWETAGWPPVHKPGADGPTPPAAP